MAFIPIDKTGRQAYTYDDRSLKVKFYMWFWETVGIPMSGGTIKGKILEFEHIKGEKKKYVNCTFKRCKFENMTLIFILNSFVEYDTPNPEFRNFKMCSIRHVYFKKVDQVMREPPEDDLLHKR